MLSSAHIEAKERFISIKKRQGAVQEMKTSENVLERHEHIIENTMSKSIRTNGDAKSLGGVDQSLGFDQKKIQNVVYQLNILLANLHVHYQKMRNYHWNVTGPDFFDYHELFENRYNTTKEQIDVIAERIRAFDYYPLSTLEEYLKFSEIMEPKGRMEAASMGIDTLADYKLLLSQMVDALNAAVDAGDIGTEDMLNGYIKALEKDHWMLASFLKSDGE